MKVFLIKFLQVFVFYYILIAFVSAEYNFTIWGWATRFFVVWASIISALALMGDKDF